MSLIDEQLAWNFCALTVVREIRMNITRYELLQLHPHFSKYHQCTKCFTRWKTVVVENDFWNFSMLMVIRNKIKRSHCTFSSGDTKFLFKTSYISLRYHRCFPSPWYYWRSILNAYHLGMLRPVKILKTCFIASSVL